MFGDAGDGDEGGEEDPGPRTAQDVRDAFEALGRDAGVTARFSGGRTQEASGVGDLRISGRAQVQVVVR